MASPMPRLDPVTSARFPASENCERLSMSNSNDERDPTASRA
jgi:hypothetical protein